MKRVIALLTIVLVSTPCLAQKLDVELTVEEPSGVVQKMAPVSGGIPVPWGQFKKDQSFAIYEGAREIPAQVLPMVVDEKGFIRWVLVDFQTDLTAKQKKTFTLKAARAGARAARALVVQQGAPGVQVDTGKVKFLIASEKPFSLFSSVEVGGRAVAGGGEVSYTENTNLEKKDNRFVADKPTSIEVEYQGPMRTTICVKGRFVGDDQNAFGYIARITAWAGHSDVHVKYSLANSNDKHYSWRRVKDSTIELRLAGAPAGAIVGTGKPGDAAVPCWMQQSSRVISAAIHSHDTFEVANWLRATPGASGPGGAKAMAGDKDLWTSAGKADVSEGWVMAKLGAAGVFVTDLYFVEDPPRRLTITKDSLVLSGVIEPLEGTQSPFQGRNRWLFDCSHLSSQYVIDFAAPQTTADLSVKAQAARARLHAFAPPAWYFETGGLPVAEFGTQADEMAVYDKWGWKYDKGQAPKAAVGQTGNIKRWSGGDDNHYVSEQDTLDALLLMYMRTGSRAYLDAGESWANYFMDLEVWRTDGWRWKDGGGWWIKTDGNRGPLGNRPQRAKDPVTGVRNYFDAGVDGKGVFAGENRDVLVLGNAKQCNCHNWGEGMVEWFMLTGDRDALESAVDCVEQNYDSQRRAFGKTPGKASGYSRDFTRANYLTHATRLCLPTDPLVLEASDYLAQVFLQRPDKEPRGFLNGGTKVDMRTIEGNTGAKGIAKMKELGVTLEADGRLSDPKTGAKWFPLSNPQIWMYPPLSRAMEIYHRLTGNEDAQDWMIAYGQAVANVLWQEKHGCLDGAFLVDFPIKGWAWDRCSWTLADNATSSKGGRVNGYLGGFHPDVAARAYSLCGEPLLKQRAADLWYGCTHPGAEVPEDKRTRTVGKWVNCYSTHEETVCFTGKTFYEWSHERKDAKPPKAVTDLAVQVQAAEAGKAVVTFTAPADEGRAASGTAPTGKVIRYQVKCSDKPIVDYASFLKAWEANKDGEVINWWMASNLEGEPAPGAPGRRESFTVTGVPSGAVFFAVRSFDDSSNRSAMSNVAKVP